MPELTLKFDNRTKMPTVKDAVIAAAKYVTGAILAMWVSMPHAVMILFWVMLADQASGLIAGGKKGEISSARGFRGLKKKAHMWILIGVAHLADKVVNVGFDFDSGLAIYFIINEIISIAENAHRAGVPIPSWLHKRLQAVADIEPTEQNKP